MAVRKKKAAKKKVAKKKAAKKRFNNKQLEVIQQLVKCPDDLKLCATVVGYSHGYIRKLVSIPYFKKALQEARNKVVDRVIKETGIDNAWVLREQVEVYKRCMQKEQVMVRVGKEMVPTGEWKFDAAGANKALENIGKNVTVNSFKETDDDGVPIDQNWTVTIVHTNARPKTSG